MCNYRYGKFIKQFRNGIPFYCHIELCSVDIYARNALIGLLAAVQDKGIEGLCPHHHPHSFRYEDESGRTTANLVKNRLGNGKQVWICKKCDHIFQTGIPDLTILLYIRAYDRSEKRVISEVPACKRW